MVVSEKEFAGNELSGVVGHPFGLLGFVNGKDGTTGGDCFGMMCEEIGICSKVFRVDCGIVVYIDQKVALSISNATVAGV